MSEVVTCHPSPLAHFVPLRGGSTYTPTESGCCQAEWQSARVVPGTPQLLGKRLAFVRLPPPDPVALSTVGTACSALVHRFLEVASLLKRGPKKGLV